MVEKSLLRDVQKRHARVEEGWVEVKIVVRLRLEEESATGLDFFCHLVDGFLNDV
jgi:imidazoleglycerol phosphate dehydratase HisB